MNRRWFLKVLVALPFVPLAAKVAAAVELAPLEPAFVARYPDISEIIAATIESRQRLVRDNVSKNNALLRHLALSGLPPEEQAALKLKWKRERERELDFKDKLRERGPRVAWSSGMVRVDSRCPSGYARWAKENLC